MTADTNPTACPSWCDRDHPAGAGAVHRREVGHVAVPGGRIPLRVVILQSPGHPALVTIAGGVFVEIHEDDGRADMAELLTVLGHGDLAALVRRAAALLQETGDDEDDRDQDRAPLIVAAPTEPPTTHTAQHGDECVAEFIDGSWTYADCGCVDCRTRLAEDEEADL